LRLTFSILGTGANGSIPANHYGERGVPLLNDELAKIHSRIREIIQTLRPVGISREERERLDDEWERLEKKLAADCE
jgi:hypothetical protein